MATLWFPGPTPNADGRMADMDFALRQQALLLAQIRVQRIAEQRVRQGWTFRWDPDGNGYPDLAITVPDAQVRGVVMILRDEGLLPSVVDFDEHGLRWCSEQVTMALCTYEAGCAD